MKENRPDMITQSTILGMGWTMSMIKKFLPEPVCRPNPHYKCAAPMKLYEKDVVLAFMETAEFTEALEKAEKRKASAYKAVTTKAEHLRLEMLDIADHITIKILPDDKLRKRTIEAKKAWHNAHRRYHRFRDYDFYDDDYDYEDSYYDDSDSYEYDYEDFDYDDVSEPMMNRWVVNYIRHNLISYDEALENLWGKVGKEDAYVNFKNAILERIAQAYPKYADECKNQMLHSYSEVCA